MLKLPKVEIPDLSNVIKWSKRSIFLVLFLGLVYITFPYWTYRSHEVVINNAEARQGLYMVYTSVGVFKVEDNWWYFQIDASDEFNAVTEAQRTGKRVVLGTTGIRWSWPWTSYPTIVSVSDLN